MIRIGVWGCRADKRGLAHQSLDYVRHLPVTRAYGIDMTADGLSPYENDWEPYESLAVGLTVSRRSQVEVSDAQQWLKGLDIVLCAETFYLDDFPDIAREEGVVTVQAANREFMPWITNPPDRRHTIPPLPDVLAMPTTWLMDTINHPHVVHLPMGVDRDQFPFRLRTNANRFVHVAGHRAAADRAGSRVVAGTFSRNPDLDIVVRSQSELGLSAARGRGVIEVENVADRRTLYEDADVLLLPRRYGGNSLVHQEALSMGIPVISLDREPENQWGGVMTIPCRSRQKMRTKGGMIPVFDGHSSNLSQRMRTLHESPSLVEELSHQADEYAKTIDWAVMTGKYMDLFASLV